MTRNPNPDDVVDRLRRAWDDDDVYGLARRWREYYDQIGGDVDQDLYDRTYDELVARGSHMIEVWEL